MTQDMAVPSQAAPPPVGEVPVPRRPRRPAPPPVAEQRTWTAASPKAHAAHCAAVLRCSCLNASRPRRAAADPAGPAEGLSSRGDAV
jgi:hypothetical protein